VDAELPEVVGLFEQGADQRDGGARPVTLARLEVRGGPSEQRDCGAIDVERVEHGRPRSGRRDRPVALDEQFGRAERSEGGPNDVADGARLGREVARIPSRHTREYTSVGLGVWRVGVGNSTDPEVRRVGQRRTPGDIIPE